MTYQSTKTYGHNLGLSCAFRQWRANHSHCQFIHGYALEVKIVFESNALDKNNWVIDFGQLKKLKQKLTENFDHKLIVAADDPELQTFLSLQNLGLAQVNVLPNVGCEAFAKYVYDLADAWLLEAGHRDRCKVKSAEVREHGANSAIFIGN